MRRNIFLLSALFLTATAGAQQVVSFSSTDLDYWKIGTATLSDEGKADVVIDTNSSAQQTFKGWGTCFNELDWLACGKMSQADQDAFHQRLFSPNGDLKITVGRIAIGASDYGASWYSCDETEDNATDFEMEHFNIDRDLTCVIPSIKAAQSQNPDMTFWASPWSPPQWMKTNKHYAQRQTSTNGCPFSVAPYDNDQFICEDDYFNAYCLYFDKFIEAYKAQGIPISTLAYQNEAYSYTPYPGCSWTAATTGKFLAQYLGPYMETHQPDLKLIFGTCNTNHYDVYTTGLGVADIDKYVDIIGLQWEGGQVISRIRTDFPQYELWQTESECGSGTFDWSAAAHTFQLINHYLANGVTTYTYWNAILEGGGYSTWGWKQNSLIQVNDGVPTYTPEYYAFKHYSHLITPGSTILQCDENNLLLSARTPEGALVVVVGNSSGMSKKLSIEIDGKFLTALLPGNSFRSYVIAEDDLMLSTLTSEAQSVLDNNGTLSAEQTAALQAAKEGGDVDALLSALKNALGETSDEEVVSDGKIVDPAFQLGGTNWYVSNQAASGDFKITTKAGRTCWNSWSNDFTSMDVHQAVKGLPAGQYKLRCLSMTADEALGDQHLYATVGGQTYVSASKAVGGIDQTWETQTTELFTIGEDDTLTVGYASTSGGGTVGWFCVTGFELIRCVDGEETAFDVTEAGTLQPSTQGVYYLYDLTRERYVQVGSTDLCGVLSYEPQLTFFPKETEATAGYYTFCTSVRSDQFFKSGYYSQMYTWFDGASAEPTGQWYFTPTERGVKLDVGQYDDGGTMPLRSSEAKYYLYYNGSVLAFTTDEAEADEFLFIGVDDYAAALTDYFREGGKPVEVAQIGDLSAASLVAAGTTTPEADTDYYLYDISQEGYVQVGSTDYCGLLSAEPSLTFRPSDTAGYYTFSTSFASDKYFKSGYWSDLFTWFDGSASVATAQWYLTPSARGVKLDVGQYDDGGTKPLRSSETKYYLYYNGSVLAFTTDEAEADEFIFITPEAQARLGNTLVIDAGTKNLSSSSTVRDVKIVRTLLADAYNTFYVPFPLGEAEVQAAFGTAGKVYRLRSGELDGEGVLTLHFGETSDIACGWPALVKPGADAAWTGEAYTFADKTVDVARNAEADNGEPEGATFAGVYQRTTTAAGDYLLDGDDLDQSTGTSAVNPTCAYFKLADGGSGIKALVLDIDGHEISTGVAGVAADGNAPTALFNMAGQRVPNRVAGRGIYVANGKKVLLE